MSWDQECAMEAGAPSKKKRRKTQSSKGVVDVAAVSKKLRKHVAVDKKLGRACALLRQVVLSDALCEATASHVFHVLEALMSAKKGRALEPWARDAVLPLFTVVEERAAVWRSDVVQARAVAAYVLEARYANELQTDDTYQFSGAARTIERTMDAWFRDAKARGSTSSTISKRSSGGSSSSSGDGAAASSAASASSEEALLSAVEADAVLSCLRVAHAHWTHLWAKTPVKSLFKKASLHRTLFPPLQRAELDTMSTKLQASIDGADRRHRVSAWVEKDSQAMTHPLRR